MILDVRNKSKSRSITNYRLRKLCQRVIPVLIKVAKLKKPEISLLFVDDEEMRELNRKFRDVDETTDVLAFPMREASSLDSSSEVLGDIVISVPRARRQAEAHRHSLEKELAILLTHGFLHLLGYKDESHRQQKKMHAKEAELINLLDKRGII